MSIINLLTLLIGFPLLILGAELLVRGASRLAVAGGISPYVVGLTIVAFGTSTPELAVNMLAIFKPEVSTEIVTGNIVGSNISNILLVLGLAALAAPLRVARALLHTSLPIMIGTAILIYLTGQDGTVDRLEGGLLFLAALVYTVAVTISSHRGAKAVRSGASVTENVKPRATGRVQHISFNLLNILSGFVLLLVGANLIVSGATGLAQLLGVSELIIGLTIVAVGTSLPEVAASVIASRRGKPEIALGNVVGSNIYNVLLVRGLSSAVAPQGLAVPAEALRFDIPLLIGISIACVPIFSTQLRISRSEGLLLFAYYMAYGTYLYLLPDHHRHIEPFSGVLIYGLAVLASLIAAGAVMRRLVTCRSL